MVSSPKDEKVCHSLVVFGFIHVKQRSQNMLYEVPDWGFQRDGLGISLSNARI